MAVGFQSFTDNGVAQLTDQEVFFYLKEKRTMTSFSQQEFANSGFDDYTFSKPSNSDFMLGLKCDGAGTWYHVTSVSSTSVTFRVYRTATTNDVTGYFFTTGNPPSSSGGLELFNSSGNRVFSSDYPVVRVAGVLSENGYIGTSVSGKQLAHVPMKEGRFYSINRTFGGFGTCKIGGIIDGYQQFTQEQWVRTAIDTNDLSENNRSRNFGPFPTGCFSSNTPSSNIYDAREYRTLVIDVTNY